MKKIVKTIGMAPRADPLRAKLSAVAVVIAAALGSGGAAGTAAADTAVAYDFRSSPIGPLGFVDGFVALAGAPYDKYVRTDVGGAYHWSESGQRWSSITDSLDMAHRSGGVLSLAVVPGAPQTLYVAAASSLDTGGVFRSTDNGVHWDFIGPRVAVAANAPYRNAGERLAVDPGDARILYFGTQRDGLQISRDGGATWRRAAQLPAGVPGVGVTFVVPAGSGVLYAGVAGAGVFKSMDGGAAWAALGGQPDRNYVPNRAAATQAGDLIVTYSYDDSGAGDQWAAPAKGAVYRFDSGGAGHAFPLGAAGGLPENEGFSALAVDPQQPGHMVVGTFKFSSGGQLWATTDGGASWARLQTAYGTKALPWWEDYYFSTGFAGLAFETDPAKRPRLWLTDGISVWTSDTDLTAPERAAWRSTADGIQELVVYEVRKAPGQPLLVAAADLQGFTLTDPSQQPTARWTSLRSFGNATSVDYCASQPAIVARVGAAGYKTEGWGGWSADGGRNWTDFATLPPGTGAGVISISAGDPDNLVWLPAGGGDSVTAPYVTTDRGQSWQPAAGVPRYNYISDFYSDQQPLAADRVTAGTFYLYGGYSSTGLWGAFFRSTDGGRSFSQVNRNSLLPSGYRHSLKAVPGIAGELFIGFEEGDRPGLWRSTDGGETWAQVPGVAEVNALGFGKAGQGGEPVLYLYGIRNGRRGLYRSGDITRLGAPALSTAHWQVLTSEGGPLPVPGIHAVEGDPDNPARVYIGTRGRGVFIGEGRAP